MTDPVRVLVVDDEAPARRRLLRLLEAMPDVTLAGQAEDGPGAVRAVAGLRERGAACDLMLLDIQMPGLDGFGALEAMAESLGADAVPPVVFQTAHDEHALRAFTVRALDYLLKPVSPARLREAVERARERRARPAAAAAAERERLAAAVAERNRELRRLLVHDERGAHLLALDEVFLARASRNYVSLHTARGVFRVRGTIGALAERLDPARFLQMNRSDVVRLDAVRALQPWSHGDYRVELPDGSALFWSRRFRARDAGRFELG